MVKDHSHMGYSFRLTARVLLCAPFHIQDSTYHGLWYTSRGALAGTRNSSMGPPHEGSIRRTIATSRSPSYNTPAYEWLITLDTEWKRVGCLYTFCYAVRLNTYKRMKPPEHNLPFKIVLTSLVYLVIENVIKSLARLWFILGLPQCTVGLPGFRYLVVRGGGGGGYH